MTLSRRLTKKQKQGLRNQSVLVAAINGTDVDTRHTAITTTRIEREEWMRKVDPAAVKLFEESASARRGFGLHKPKAIVH